MKEQLFEEFLHPSEEFSPMPFWFWNDDLKEEEIERQMRAFKEKGVDGVVIHPRLGLTPNIEYMGQSWMHYVRFAVDLAKTLDMKVILYDEAMYPSGSAHGAVVRTNPAYAARGLFMRCEDTLAPGERLVGSTVRDGQTYFFVESDTRGVIRGVYYGEDDCDPDAPRAADLLNPASVATFIAQTHERYYQALGDEFGKTIIAIFTDEPSMAGRACLGGHRPWTGDFMDDFTAAGLCEDDLYYLFADTGTPEGREVNRRYGDAVYERFGRVYYKQISDWCAAHGIALMGHPEKSTDIGYLSYFQIPCQDIVWRYLYPGEPSAVTGDHSTMGKCASDSARHAGKRRNGNECFGVCGHRDDPYAFEREDMKWYIDWLFVRGCNFIIPHAFYYSLRDKRKEERPPEVGMHSVFWGEYKEISDYIKRMCALNCDSVNVTDVAILCPEESLSWQAAKPLYEHQVEFNYLERALLPDARIDADGVSVGAYTYRVIITDREYDPATEAYLAAFAAAGGTLIRYDENDEQGYLDSVRAASATLTRVTGDAPGLRMTRVRKYASEVLVFTNEGEQTVDVVVAPSTPVTHVLDAEAGTVTPCAGKDYHLVLERRKSIILAI